MISLLLRFPVCIYVHMISPTNKYLNAQLFNVEEPHKSSKFIERTIEEEKLKQVKSDIIHLNKIE